VELVNHRAEIAVGLVHSGMVDTLLVSTDSIDSPSEFAPALVSFLVSLLQPDLVREPEWSNSCRRAVNTLARARKASSALTQPIADRPEMLWNYLCQVPEGGQLPPGFLEDCADLAYFVPPADGVILRRFVGECYALVKNSGLATLCVLWANAGYTPEGVLLADLAQAGRETQIECNRRWQAWRGPVRAPMLNLWIAVTFVHSLLEEVAMRDQLAEEAVQPAALPPEEAEEIPEPPTPQRGRAVLRDLVGEAPAEFRCQISGQLMMDPVRTPHGYLVERQTLARSLRAGHGRCPLTAEELSLEACDRVSEMRRGILAWVRSKRLAAA